MFCMGKEHIFVQVHFAEARKIKNYKNTGYCLTDHCGPGSAFDAPSEAKNKKRVKYSIDHSACQHAGHRKTRTSVGTYQMAAAGSQYIKRNAYSSDSGVVNGIWHNVRCSAKKMQERIKEQKNCRRDQDTADSKHRKTGACNMAGFFVMSCA